jgi:hypothetical protein
VREEIFKTDRGYRTRLFAAYAAGIFILAAGIGFGLPPFLRYLDACAVMTFLTITEICAITFLLSFIVPAFLLLRTGRKILFHQQVPFPGMKVMRDTKVIFGKKAAFRGKLLIALGIFSILAALAGSFVTHRSFEKFRHFNPFHSVVRTAKAGARNRISNNSPADLPTPEDYVYLTEQCKK